MYASLILVPKPWIGYGDLFLKMNLYDLGIASKSWSLFTENH